MKQIALFIIALCCTPLGLQAQQPQIYTLKSCLEYGLQNNYSLQIVRNEEQVSKNNATPGNAGYLPTLDLTAGYTGTVDNTNTKVRATGESVKENGVFDQTVNVGLNLNWTIFDGFNITANYQKLKELERQGETNTRIAIEDLIANLAAEYYNYVQQKIRLQNFRYAVSLSKERLRIVEERYHIGNFSRLDYQQAKVDFNADSAKYMKQQELLHTSRIQLNELMANEDVDQPIVIEDSIIKVNAGLRFEELWNATLLTNASLLKAEQNNTLAMLDYKKVNSRNYPYLKMNTGYGYTFNKYDIASNSQRGNLGANFGVTIGFNIFDGNRRREKNNARIYIRSDKGDMVQLDNLIELTDGIAPPKLYRYNRFVSATVSAGLAEGKTIGQGLDEMDKIAKETLDDTFRTALTGDSKEYRESSSSLMFAFILAIVLIYLILAAQFESFKDPLIIMLTVPLAIAGALVFMYFGGITMNIFSQIGIIMLIGLVAKNGILIVEFANQKQETGEDKLTAIKDAALQRLRPILMTSASTILGLIPLAFASGEGCNQRIAMGTAVVGGMLVSTLLTMYIVPAIYSYISTNRSNKLKRE